MEMPRDAFSCAFWPKTIWSRRLERVTQRELNEPRRADGAGDFPKRAVRIYAAGGAAAYARRAENRFHVVHRRVAEIGVIPDVKEVRRKSERLPLGQFKILD